MAKPTPAASEPVAALAERIVELLDGGDAVVILVGDQPQGLAVLRFRPVLWSRGPDCYLAELYVAPAQRGRGFGRALAQAAIRERGAHTMDIGWMRPTSPHVDCMRALDSASSSGAEGPPMYGYELDLVG